MIRIGQGYDVHRFIDEGEVILGGVTIDYDKGLEAHSDGDVVLHALCDALLGAVALGDIGKHFPDTDAEFKGADSRVLLRDVYGKVQKKGISWLMRILPSLLRHPKWHLILLRCVAILQRIYRLILSSLMSRQQLRKNWVSKVVKKVSRYKPWY